MLDPCFSQLWIPSTSSILPGVPFPPSVTTSWPAPSQEESQPCRCSPWPFQRWDLGTNQRDQPLILPISWGARPEPSCIHGVLSRRSGMPQNPPFVVSSPHQDFPMCHHCGFKPFCCCETAHGGWIPSGRAGSPRNGGVQVGIGTQEIAERPPQTGILPEPHGQPEPGFRGEPLPPCPVSLHRSPSPSCRMGGTEGAH